MLKKILSVSGKPGLFRLVSQGNNMLLLETLDNARRRVPSHGRDKIISLGDIAIYTDAEEKPLVEVMQSISEKYNAGVVNLEPRTASNAELASFMESVLPEYDRDRVHFSDIRKLITWYNILVNAGITTFVEEEK